METIIFMALVIGGPGLLVLVLGGMYLSDPKGWQATGRRVSTMIRANLESGKQAKQVGPGVTSKELISDWDNQFEGKDLVVQRNEKPHEIIKTRFDTKYGDRYYWWCRCGKTDWHVKEDYALADYKVHLDWAKQDEARKKKAEEYKRKGLDREW